MALQAELETHLSQDLERNSKNCTSSKTIKSAHGTFDLETLRDRNGSFTRFTVSGAVEQVNLDNLDLTK